MSGEERPPPWRAAPPTDYMGFPIPNPGQPPPHGWQQPPSGHFQMPPPQGGSQPHGGGWLGPPGYGPPHQGDWGPPGTGPPPGQWGPPPPGRGPPPWDGGWGSPGHTRGDVGPPPSRPPPAMADSRHGGGPPPSAGPPPRDGGWGSPGHTRDVGPPPNSGPPPRIFPNSGGSNVRSAGEKASRPRLCSRDPPGAQLPSAGRRARRRGRCPGPGRRRCLGPWRRRGNCASVRLARASVCRRRSDQRRGVWRHGRGRELPRSARPPERRGARADPVLTVGAAPRGGGARSRLRAGQRSCVPEPPGGTQPLPPTTDAACPPAPDLACPPAPGCCQGGRLRGRGGAGGQQQRRVLGRRGSRCCEAVAGERRGGDLAGVFRGVGGAEGWRQAPGPNQGRARVRGGARMPGGW
ncbi:hypothetical protein T484DRAFT_1874815, partial [Baffinella frigidus]